MKQSRSVRDACSENRSKQKLCLIVSRGTSAMNALHDKTVDVSPFASPPGVGAAARRPAASNLTVRTVRRAQPALQAGNWRRRSEQWGSLMVAAQGGESRAYEQLLRELDAWLRRYYARRLPRPAAEDARQEALL